MVRVLNACYQRKRYGPIRIAIVKQKHNKMEFNVISNEKFQELINKISELQRTFTTRARESLVETWLTNHEVSKILRVTPRTLQNYRDQRILPFSQVGSKIYYRASDIQKHLDDHYIKPGNWDSQGKLNFNK